MIVVLAAGYVAIGLALAAVAARRRARGLELVTLAIGWPLYAPLWLDRPPPADDRVRVLEVALDRVGRVGDRAVTADDASDWVIRAAGATRELAALDRALAVHAGHAAADSPALAHARAERRRRAEALAATDALFAELTVQVGLAAWVGDAELRRLVEALHVQLVALAPAE